MVTPPTGGESATTVNDFYQLGHLANQTNGAGTLLASYTYDSTGAPVSVQVGSDPASAPRYWYVYNAHGDVVSLVNASGAAVATYAYDSWGNLLAGSSESIPNANGWVNPYRYDGRDGARYDASDGLYWLSVRAYDPSIGRFLSRDPLGRAPLFVADNPYVYAGNNPLSNVDPSGQKVMGASSSQVKQAAKKQASKARVVTKHGTPVKQPAHNCDATCKGDWGKAAAAAVGVLAVMAFIIATILTDWAAAATAVISMLFGGNPLAAIFAEATGMFALASFALGEADAAMRSMGYSINDGSDGGRAMKSFEDMKTDVDGVLYVLAFATAALAIGPILLAITEVGATAGAIFWGLAGIVTVAAGTMVAVDGILQTLKQDLSQDPHNP